MYTMVHRAQTFPVWEAPRLLTAVRCPCQGRRAVGPTFHALRLIAQSLRIGCDQSAGHIFQPPSRTFGSRRLFSSDVAGSSQSLGRQGAIRTSCALYPSGAILCKCYFRSN